MWGCFVIILQATMYTVTSTSYNLTLNLFSDDASGLNTTYEWYKSNKVGGVPFSDSSDAIEVRIKKF